MIIGTGSHQPRFLFLFDSPTEKEFKDKKLDKVTRGFDKLINELQDIYFSPLIKVKDAQPYEMWPYLRQLITLSDPEMIIAYDPLVLNYISEFSGHQLDDSINLIKINDKPLYHYSEINFRFLEQMKWIAHLTRP